MENHSDAIKHISNLAGDLLKLIRLAREGNTLAKGGKEAWTEEKKNDNDADGDGTVDTDEKLTTFARTRRSRAKNTIVVVR